jgi:hypothetical protein
MNVDVSLHSAEMDTSNATALNLVADPMGLQACSQPTSLSDFNGLMPGPSSLPPSGLTAGLQPAHRKRTRSLGGGGGDPPPSPESMQALSDDRKKLKQRRVTAAPLQGDLKIAGEKKQKNKHEPEFCETCVYCSRKGTPVNMIQCDQCDQFYHLICCLVPTDKHDQAAQIITLLGWTCRVCRADFKREFAALKDQLEAMRLQVADLLTTSLPSTSAPDSASTYASKLSAGPPSDAAGGATASALRTQSPDIAVLVDRAVRDINRRKYNVIISGLTEAENPDKDFECVIDFANELLHMDLRSHLKACKRIGKVVVSQPRRLLVMLDSVLAADELLRRAPLLRDHVTVYVSSHIFINRDLSPDEAKLAYLRRKERRDLREGGSAATVVRYQRDGGNTIFATHNQRDGGSVATVVRDVRVGSSTATVVTHRPAENGAQHNNKVFYRKVSGGPRSAPNTNVITIPTSNRFSMLANTTEPITVVERPSAGAVLTQCPNGSDPPPSGRPGSD